MINPVDNRNSYTGAYERGGKKAARIEGEAPAFLLPDDGGVIWDRSSSSKASPKPKAKKEKEEYHPSRAAKEQEAAKEPEKAKEAEAAKQPGSSFFSKIAGFFKDLFSRLWYGDEGKPGEEKKKEEAPSAEAAAGGDTAGGRDQRIRDMIAKKDSEALVRELTEDGKKKAARNTGLLTYYDRFGRIVKPRDSEAARIMRGSDTKKGVEKRPQGNYRRYI